MEKSKEVMCPICKEMTIESKCKNEKCDGHGMYIKPIKKSN